MATFCVAEKDRVFSPSFHSEGRRRPADWGVIPSPHCSGHDPSGKGANVVRSIAAGSLGHLGNNSWDDPLRQSLTREVTVRINTIGIALFTATALVLSASAETTPTAPAIT